MIKFTEGTRYRFRDRKGNYAVARFDGYNHTMSHGGFTTETGCQFIAKTTAKPWGGGSVHVAKIGGLKADALSFDCCLMFGGRNA